MHDDRMRWICVIWLVACEPSAHRITKQLVVEQVTADAARVTVVARDRDCATAKLTISAAADDRELFTCLAALQTGATVQHDHVELSGGCGGKVPNDVLGSCGLRGSSLQISSTPCR
jgi:hypothetical protein